MNKTITAIMVIIAMVMAFTCSVLQASPLIFVARKHQIQRNRSIKQRLRHLEQMQSIEKLWLLELKNGREFRRVERLKKFLKYRGNPSLEEEYRLKRELMCDIQFKIKTISKRMIDLNVNKEWYKKYLMEYANVSRRDGCERLAEQFENIANGMMAGEYGVNEKSSDVKRGDVK